MEESGWVYIMTNKPDGTLHVGVTSNLARHVGQHRAKAEGLAKRPASPMRLVYAEQHNYMERAIRRQSRIKKWPRGWKLHLIASQNPEWRDLFDRLR